MARRHSVGDLVRVERGPITLGGDRSCVMRAVLYLHYSDGTANEFILKYEPDGAMYEVYEEAVIGLQRLIGQSP